MNNLLELSNEYDIEADDIYVIIPEVHFRHIRFKVIKF